MRRFCKKCDSSFMIRGNKADINQRFCSKACSASVRFKGTHYNYGKMKPGLEATEHPTLMQIAWAAGIYEGEGSCCRMSKTSQQVHLGQKDRWVVDRFRALFGGSIHEREMNGDPFYDWHIHGARARGFLMTMFTFLSPRRQDQVTACL